MTLNVDWFSMFGDRARATALVGSGFDDPTWQAAHDRQFSSDIFFDWIFPQAAALNQLIVSNYDFGDNSGSGFDSEAALIIDGSIIALKRWDFLDRINDRGSVWDLNFVVLQGTPVQFRYRQERGVNTNGNEFVTALTGTWLRDI